MTVKIGLLVTVNSVIVVVGFIQTLCICMALFGDTGS
jgi:hypothetical protein